jgi:HSP20 family protein
MFKIFSIGLQDIFNKKNIEKINRIVDSFIENIDIEEFTEDNNMSFSNESYEERESANDYNFIKFKRYEDMYVLSIDLRGIDLRELSIRYDPGIIEINLIRSEVEKSNFGVVPRSTFVRKAYNKKIEDIEEIDTNQIIKSIDNEILTIRMQQKYSLDSIIEVDSYEDNVDN